MESAEERLARWQERCHRTEDDLTAERARRLGDLTALEAMTARAEHADALIAALGERLATAEAALARRPSARLRRRLARWPRAERVASAVLRQGRHAMAVARPGHGR